MKLTRVFLSSASVAALSLGMATPSFAYFVGTPPLPTTQMRQSQVLRPAYADAYESILSLARLRRENPTSDTTGRAWLARSIMRRPGQRNFRRHVLGSVRGYDYRVLNANGDTRRSGFEVTARSSLPFSLVRTGRDYRGRVDRPTSRAIRSGALNDRTERLGFRILGIVTRDRDVLGERAASLQ